MARKSRPDVRKHAQAIRDRLEDKSLKAPAPFKASAKAFVKTQGMFEEAAVAADEAEEARSAALEAVGAADSELDVGVGRYADDVSAAKLGPRQNPFKPFSKYAPSQIKALAYATEAKAVRELVAAVAKTKPPAQVAKSGAALLARCTAVEKALKAYGGPASAYQKALAARDVLLPDLVKAISTVKIHAASAFAGDDATLAALFAPPDALQVPRPRKKPAKKGGDGDTAAPEKKGGDGDTAAPDKKGGDKAKPEKAANP